MRILFRIIMVRIVQKKNCMIRTVLILGQSDIFTLLYTILSALKNKKWVKGGTILCQ